MPTDRHDNHLDESRVLKRPSLGLGSAHQARIFNSTTSAAGSSAPITLGRENFAPGASPRAQHWHAVRSRSKREPSSHVMAQFV